MSNSLKGVLFSFLVSAVGLGLHSAACAGTDNFSLTLSSKLSAHLGDSLNNLDVDHGVGAGAQLEWLPGDLWAFGLDGEWDSYFGGPGHPRNTVYGGLTARYSFIPSWKSHWSPYLQVGVSTGPILSFRETDKSLGLGALAELGTRYYLDSQMSINLGFRYDYYTLAQGGDFNALNLNVGLSYFFAQVKLPETNDGKAGALSAGASAK
jgi:Outer membrane protein beta-barrel domain